MQKISLPMFLFCWIYFYIITEDFSIVKAYSNYNNHSTSNIDQINFVSNTTSETIELTTSKMSISSCGVYWGDNLRPLRILITSSDQYFPVFMNWLVHYHHICPVLSNIYFICLDNNVRDKLRLYNLKCSHIYQYTKGYHNLWLVRVKITQTLMKQGFDVLMTDVDAIWLRNPFPYIEKHIRYSDIVASRASHPERVYQKLGAAICMGFIYVKASVQSIALWGEFVNVMTIGAAPDDQYVLNNLLLKLGLQYTNKINYVDSSLPDTGFFIHKEQKYGITLLPHITFRRVCYHVDKVAVLRSVVVHCMSEKTKGSKHSTQKAVDIWALKKNWKDISYNSTTMTTTTIATIASNSDNVVVTFDDYLKNISNRDAFITNSNDIENLVTTI